MTEINIYKSPWQAIKLMLLCTPFVLGGVWMLSTPDGPHWLGWISVLFFGLGYPLGVYNLLDRRPQLIISEVGILHRDVHREFINWGIIQDAYLVEMHKQKMICLVVPPSFEPSTKKGRFARQIASVSKAMGFQELTLPVSAASVDPVKLLLILALKEAEPSYRPALLQEFIT